MYEKKATIFKKDEKLYLEEEGSTPQEITIDNGIDYDNLTESQKNRMRKLTELSPLTEGVYNWYREKTKQCKSDLHV
jgi:hypothetical protein